MNRTKRAHCIWQLTRAFTHFLQNSLHVLQIDYSKFKKKKGVVFLSFDILQISSEIKLSLSVFLISSFQHDRLLMLNKVQDVRALQINTEDDFVKIKNVIVSNTHTRYKYNCESDICESSEK